MKIQAPREVGINNTPKSKDAAFATITKPAKLGQITLPILIAVTWWSSSRCPCSLGTHRKTIGHEKVFASVANDRSVKLALDYPYY